MPSDIFSSLASMRQKEVPVVIQLAFRSPDPNGRTADHPVEGAEKIKFMIRPLSHPELAAADEILDTEKPPETYTEEPAPRGVGMVKVFTGFNEEDPDYIARRRKLMPRRDALLSLHGCPMLMESTPGADIDTKITALLDQIPATVVSLLAAQVESLSLTGAVGEADVSAFFSAGSDKPPRQKRSNSPSRTSGRSKP